VLFLTTVILAALQSPTTIQLVPLTDQQIEEAIALGQRGDVPVARARSLDFDVFVEGPVGRIAAAAQKASKELRPFTKANVTEAMQEPRYRVYLVSLTNHDARSTPNHIVLMPRGAKAVGDAIQPIRENGRVIVWEAFFDRLPADDFDVVVAASSGQRHYKIDAKARAQIR
jgi:hypothetical protein